MSPLSGSSEMGDLPELLQGPTEYLKGLGTPFGPEKVQLVACGKLDADRLLLNTTSHR